MVSWTSGLHVARNDIGLYLFADGSLKPLGYARKKDACSAQSKKSQNDVLYCITTGTGYNA